MLAELFSASARRLALVANRADNSISVLSIRGKEVQVVDTVAMGEQVSAVAFTPDGKRALASKNVNNKAAVLEVDGQKVTYTKYDMLVGLFPYNLGITPNGKLALTANNGNSGSADGSVTLARSLGVETVELDMTVPFTAARARNEGLQRLLETRPGVEFVQFVDGDCEVVPGWLERARQELEARPDTAVVCGRRRERFPEASVYNRLCDLEWDTPVGEAVGNYMDDDISILKVNGTTVTNTGKLVKLPGHPASMRSVVP